jgi:hypothetical protein
MQDFWGKMNRFDLPARSRQQLAEVGFTIIPGPVPVDDLAQFLPELSA